MKAIARLVLTNFAPTPLLRAFSIAGFVMFGVTFWALRARSHNDDFFMWFGAIADLLLIAATSLMPLMFGRLARSHAIGVLPLGRLKLLISAFLTLLIVSLPVPLCISFGFSPAVLWQFVFTLLGQMIAIGWLYLAMYFVSSQRAIAGYIKGLLVILAAVISPLRDSITLDVTVIGKAVQLAVIWGVFSTGFLLWPMWKTRIARVRNAATAGSNLLLRRRVEGREVDLMLGTAHPWLLATAQVVPIAFAATIGFYKASVWIYYLTIFSTVAGAIACQAAERSRALWLRSGWSREELFARVERSFWRHNSYVLAVLVVLMIGIGSYAGLPATLIAAGLPLLAIATLLSTYLGLMITRGLHLLEAMLAITSMMVLMAVAILAARSTTNLRWVVLSEVVLFAAVIVFRSVARRRWAHIDWMLCRPDRALSARAAS